MSKVILLLILKDLRTQAFNSLHPLSKPVLSLFGVTGAPQPNPASCGRKQGTPWTGLQSVKGNLTPNYYYILMSYKFLNFTSYLICHICNPWNLCRRPFRAYFAWASFRPLKIICTRSVRTPRTVPEHQILYDTLSTRKTMVHSVSMTSLKVAAPSCGCRWPRL